MLIPLNMSRILVVYRVSVQLIEIYGLLKSRGNTANSLHSRSQYGSRSKSRQKGALCFYHYWFKENTHKCIQPFNCKPNESDTDGLASLKYH